MEPSSAEPETRAAEQRPPSVPFLTDTGSFVRETGTTEVSSRSTDFGEPPAQPVLNNRAVLQRMEGVRAGEVNSIEQTPFGMGRHLSNDLSIDDTSISRFHARIVAENGEYWIEDLGSSNGTFVQGQRVKRGKLSDNDWIQLGPRVGFRFSLTDLHQEGLLRRLYEASTRDALTGAYNRAHFEDRLRAEIAFAVRHSTDASLVLLDLDHFKEVNDTYGHPGGDAVLRHVATVCSQSLREEDIFARFGGEEFAVVLRGVPLRGALRLAERLRLALEAAPATFDGHQIRVTLSAGCASLSTGASGSPEDLIAMADRRLYIAKNNGRNRVVASG